MTEAFYENSGSLLSPGDLFNSLPYVRVHHPLAVARKPAYTLPKSFVNKLTGELREIFEVGKHEPHPPFHFKPPGEEILVGAKTAGAIFLTWGSEVEDDQRRGSLHKKDWLIAPIFPMSDLIGIKVPETDILMSDAIRSGTSPRFFPLLPLPGTENELYVDFRKIGALSAKHFAGVPRTQRLAHRALNDFYHHLIWFFTRKKLFFEPVTCTNCGTQVDLDTAFEGQPIEPETQ